MTPLLWLLILLCANNFPSTFALENPHKFKNILISSKELQLLDPQNHDPGTRQLMAPENITSSEKRQRGRGSTGGANVVRPRPAEKSDALLYRPYCFNSYAVLGFSFSLLLAFPFRFS